MTTNSEAYFARRLLSTLQQHHPDLAVETVKGSRIGPGSQRVIRMTHSGGKFAQFPFPRKGLHAGDVSDELCLSACSMLRLQPIPKAMIDSRGLGHNQVNEDA